MSELQTLDGRTRRALQQPGPSLRTMQIVVDSGAGSLGIDTAAGTYIIPIGVVNVPGLRLDRFWLMTGTLLTADGTNYYTFKPWMARPATLGGVEKVYLGTPRSTLRHFLPAGQPVQMHDEFAIRVQVPRFSTVGVDVVVTGTPASASLLVRPLFQVDFSLV